jgi:hypothetical protein
MTTLYKLTNAYDQTHNKTQWGENVTHSGTGEGPLCGPGWIHAYTDPVLAALLNPIHADFAQPRLWEAEGEVTLNDNGIKVGCLSLTTVKRIPLPEITRTQRVRFAILCALEVYPEPGFVAWAQARLSGMDHSRESARAAAAAWAARAAEAAAAAWAARAAAAAWAARAAAAAWAARAAEAAAAAKPLDLIALARQAVSEP